MSKPAAEILQKFYLKLRDHATSADGTPITARQLESLVRLAEARARIDLREEITAQDAMVSSFLLFNQIPLTPSKIQEVYFKSLDVSLDSWSYIFYL